MEKSDRHVKQSCSEDVERRSPLADVVVIFDMDDTLIGNSWAYSKCMSHLNRDLFSACYSQVYGEALARIQARHPLLDECCAHTAAKAAATAIAGRQFAESPLSDDAKLAHGRLREEFEEYDAFLHETLQHLQQLGAAVHVVTNNDGPAALGYLVPLYEHAFFPKTFGKTGGGGLRYTYVEGEGQMYDGGDASATDTFHMKPHKTDPCFAGTCKNKDVADPLTPWVYGEASKADRYAAIMLHHSDRSVVIAVGDDKNADLETLRTASRQQSSSKKHLYGILYEGLARQGPDWNRANAERVLRQFISKTVAKIEEIGSETRGGVPRVPQLPRLALDLKIVEGPRSWKVGAAEAFLHQPEGKASGSTCGQPVCSGAKCAQPVCSGRRRGLQCLTSACDAVSGRLSQLESWVDGHGAERVK